MRSVRFEDCFGLIIDLEVGNVPNGGYHNDPQDPGGETKWGISKRAHPDLDIASLTLADAHRIYKTEYWDKAGCDQIFPARARLAVFDCAVNQGVFIARSRWRRAAKEGFDQPEVFLALRAIRYSKTRNYDRWGLRWMHRLFVIAREMGKL